jgi:hypothetical protein
MANFVLGAGKVYFATRTNGVLAGEKLIQETPMLSFSVKTERVQQWTSDGAIAELALDVPTKVERSGKFTCQDISDYNLGLFAIGAASTISTTSGAVTGSAINGGVALAADTYYQLGLATHPHVGVRDITSVALKTGGTTYTENTHYTVNLELGRIYIPAGSTCIGAIVTADYSTTVSSWGQMASSDSGAVEGALRFVSDNTAGEDRDWYFPVVVLSAEGDAELKSRDKVQELSFGFSIQKPTTGSAVYCNGRPV